MFRGRDPSPVIVALSSPNAKICVLRFRVRYGSGDWGLGNAVRDKVSGVRRLRY